MFYLLRRRSGSFLSSVAFGYLVERYGSYNVPFVPIAAFLALGAFFGSRLIPPSG
jgi:hypothetical protein